MTILNTSTLAEHYGVHRQTILSWARKGMPYITKGGKGREWQFNSVEVDKWKEQQAINNAIGDTSLADAEELKRRKLAADTTIAEVEAARAKSLVVPVEDMERTVRDLSIEIATRMMIVGKRCFPNNLEYRNLVDEEVRQVLTDAIDIELDYEEC
jgi:phage terminase Nu1 subunit (DNA packaging protein)